MVLQLKFGVFRQAKLYFSYFAYIINIQWYNTKNLHIVTKKLVFSLAWTGSVVYY